MRRRNTPGAYLIANRHPDSGTGTDVATVHATGSGPRAAVPAAASIVRFTEDGRLAMPNPMCALSALYLHNASTRAVQIRLYQLPARRARQPTRRIQLASQLERPHWPTTAGS